MHNKGREVKPMLITIVSSAMRGAACAESRDPQDNSRGSRMRFFLSPLVGYCYYLAKGKAAVNRRNRFHVSKSEIQWKNPNYFSYMLQIAWSRLTSLRTTESKLLSRQGRPMIDILSSGRGRSEKREARNTMCSELLVQIDHALCVMRQTTKP